MTITSIDNTTDANATKVTYDSLNMAYDFFNVRLFNGELPPCLITLQRRNKSYGYFAGGRFGDREGTLKTDEIALNPSHFADRDDRATLSTLVHEMVHLWQHHFGKPPRQVYHNKEWAEAMKGVGLHPSTTGAPGGKETGPQCSHYIIEGGAYDEAYADLAPELPKLYVQLWDEAEKEKRKKKNASKTKYTCPSCDTNVWGKPGLRIHCADCDVFFVDPEADAGSDEEDEEDEDA